MSRSLAMCLVILGVTRVTQQISSKVDFAEEESTVEKTYDTDEDLEVKHTIVVSTKLKNNNRRGLHTDGDAGVLTYKFGNKNANDEDSGEVPIVKAFKSVETTQIRTPDSRVKPVTYTYPELVLRNRNSRDEFDLYPNLATNPMQWKPSSFFNNVNWWNQDNAHFDSHARRSRPDYQKFNRRVNDDGVREFYCKKCREMNGLRGCIQPKTNSLFLESTTPKIKIDGKLAKLN
ncbi:uncharacterized protein LOC113401061 [Vanessa tameamea]|uniref:Uncharacterized protein LOC113401061 n=1 Tax=Vanessa tameamea TaxID=334116 RepID=A0A8B8IJM4_VANTA|nr:uncharacterized protein LOC113401061 [Vanessa tameamea]